MRGNEKIWQAFGRRPGPHAPLPLFHLNFNWFYKHFFDRPCGSDSGFIDHLQPSTQLFKRRLSSVVWHANQSASRESNRAEHRKPRSRQQWAAISKEGTGSGLREIEILSCPHDGYRRAHGAIPVASAARDSEHVGEAFSRRKGTGPRCLV